MVLSGTLHESLPSNGIRLEDDCTLKHFSTVKNAGFCSETCNPQGDWPIIEMSCLDVFSSSSWTAEKCNRCRAVFLKLVASHYTTEICYTLHASTWLRSRLILKKKITGKTKLSYLHSSNNFHWILRHLYKNNQVSLQEKSGSPKSLEYILSGPWMCIQISWQSTYPPILYFTLNYKCQPTGGTRGKITESQWVSLLRAKNVCTVAIEI